MIVMVTDYKAIQAQERVLQQILYHSRKKFKEGELFLHIPGSVSSNNTKFIQDCVGSQGIDKF